jgi:hypothetical protein
MKASDIVAIIHDSSSIDSKLRDDFDILRNQVCATHGGERIQQRETKFLTSRHTHP